jgi:hypothetical protein
VIARIQTVEAATLTNGLFMLALPLTYGAMLGAIVHAGAQPPRTLRHATALTFGVLVSIALELAAATRLVHWELILMSLRESNSTMCRMLTWGFGTRHARAGQGGHGATSRWPAAYPPLDPIGSQWPTTGGGIAIRRS